MELNFFEEKPEDIEQELINLYLEMVGPCSPGSPQNNFLKVITYMLILQQRKHDTAFKQNFWRYATGDFLEELGVFKNVARIEATSSQGLFKVILLSSYDFKVTIQKGIKVTAGDGTNFLLKDHLEFEPGETEKTAIFICDMTGEKGNGYIPGQINKLIDESRYIKSVSNIEYTQGGAEAETEEEFRERGRETPESYSVAGPSGAYEFWVKNINKNIVSVHVDSPSPGVVEVFPLLKGGEIPEQSVLDEIKKYLNDKTIRPLTDNVIVSKPNIYDYILEVKYWLSETDLVNIDKSKQTIESIIQEWIDWTKSELGKDILPEELIYLCRQGKNGTKIRRLETNIVYTEILEDTVAIPTDVVITYMGVEDERNK
ncbi:MAG: baseplate J/gp47 family protein [Clostridium butyricum]